MCVCFFACFFTQLDFFKASSSKSMHARFPSVEQRRLHAQAPPPPEIELDFVHQLQNPRKVHHQRHSSSHGSRPPSIQESIGGGGPRTPKSPSSPSFLGFVSGRRGSTSSEKKRSKSRPRSKSPFRSFRWPKSKSRPSQQAQAGSYSDDEGDVTESTLKRDGDEIEGMLVRKHEWESTTKKASNRSWDKVCVVLKGTKMLFYKDQKSYRSSPDSLYRGEPPMELLGGEAEVATDYTKKKHVFRLKVTNGGECLFQASDDEEMSQWVGAINSVAEAGASGS